MKTAVSIPDHVFAEADELASRRRVSRSEIYTTALRALLDADANITERLDEVFGHVAEPDPFDRLTARRTLDASDW